MGKKILSLFQKIWSDGVAILKSPVSWGPKEWSGFVGVLMVTAFLVYLDPGIQQFFQERRNENSDWIAEGFKIFGYGTYVLPSILLLYLYGLQSNNRKARQVSFILLECYLLSGLFSSILKFATGRTRPFIAKSALEWLGPSSTKNNSFPSGHSTTVFALAPVLARKFAGGFVGPAIYVIAVITGLSRMNLNRHWASDVFFGAVLGYFTATWILKLEKEFPKERPVKG